MFEICRKIPFRVPKVGTISTEDSYYAGQYEPLENGFLVETNMRVKIGSTFRRSGSRGRQLAGLIQIWGSVRLVHYGKNICDPEKIEGRIENPSCFWEQPFPLYRIDIGGLRLRVGIQGKGAGTKAPEIYRQWTKTIGEGRTAYHEPRSTVITKIDGTKYKRPYVYLPQHLVVILEPTPK